VTSGCGSEETPSAQLPDALGYAPKDAFTVVLVPTDFEGEQLRRLGNLVGPWLRENHAQLRDIVTETDAFGRRIAPLLGDTLVIAAYGDQDDPGVVAALETPPTRRRPRRWPRRPRRSTCAPTARPLSSRSTTATTWSATPSPASRPATG
jgi:hypothetical protein